MQSYIKDNIALQNNEFLEFDQQANKKWDRWKNFEIVYLNFTSLFF